MLESTFGQLGSYLIVLSAVLLIVTLGVMYFFLRSQLRTVPVLAQSEYASGSAPAPSKKHYKPCAVLRLVDGEVSEKVAHYGEITAYRGDQLVILKPNGQVVRRSARRVKAL